MPATSVQIEPALTLLLTAQVNWYVRVMRNQRTAAIRVTVAVIGAFAVAALATSCGSNDTPAETSAVTVTTTSPSTAT